MPAFFPIIAIAFVILFMSTHTLLDPPKKEKKPLSPSEDLAKAFEKVIQSSGETRP